jgi:high-affinity iron transporter
VLGVLALFLLAVLVLQASGGVSDPTDPNARMSHSAVVFDSGLLVFREGLESILVLAAVTANHGRHQSLRRRCGGCLDRLAATVATWFVVVAAIGRLASAATSCRRRPG